MAAESGRLVIGQMSTGTLTRWVVVAPGDPEPTVHEIESKEDYAWIIREALGDAVTGDDTTRRRCPCSGLQPSPLAVSPFCDDHPII